MRASAASAIGWLTQVGHGLGTVEALEASQPVLDSLAKALEDPQPRVRIAAAGAFGRLGEAATCRVAETLVALLADVELHVQAGVYSISTLNLEVAAAGTLARHFKAIAMKLTSQLKDAKPRARQQAGSKTCLFHSFECL